jgi:hypothetical protein
MELLDEARLAHAGRPDDRDERRMSLGLDAPEGLLQHAELLVPPDEPCLQTEPWPFAPRPRLDPERHPCRDGLGLALQVERLELAVLDHVLRGGVRAGPDDDLSGLGRRLEPRGRVHGVAGQHAVALTGGALEVDEHLAGLDADPHRERGLALGREPAVQLGQDGVHLEGGANRALRVVLVGPRDPEDRQDRIAHELLEEPLVPRDLLGDPVERATDDGLDDLGILALCEGRRADEVGEQRRGELAFLPSGRGRSESGTAAIAEPGVVGVLPPAGGARDHGGTLRRPTVRRASDRAGRRWRERRGHPYRGSPSRRSRAPARRPT